MRFEVESLGFIEWEYRDHGTAEILNIVVNPNLRRHGIGRDLLQHVLDDLDQADIRYVYVFSQAENKGAHKFYQACGFELAGKLANFYRNDAAVILGRLVNAPA